MQELDAGQKEYLHDVITHRQAWRDVLVKVRNLTDDDDGTGYYSHEIRAFDRTFDKLATLMDRSQ